MTSSSLHQPGLSVHFARVVIGRAAERGLDSSVLLHSVRLTPELLANPLTRITPAQLGSLLRAVWLNLDDELCGFGLDSQRFGNFALMARQMVGSATLGEALRYSFKFINLTSGSMRWELLEDQGLRLELSLIDPTRDPDHFLEEFILLLWHRFSNWLIGERIPLAETRFRFERPAHWREYRLMFPGEFSFGHPVTSITLSGSWMRSPVIRSRIDLHRYLQRTPDEWFIKQIFDGSVSDRVLHALGESNGAITLESLACHWKVSSRTLHRQLRREGSSFRKLHEQLRKDRAVTMLLAENCQVKQVAHALKMTEPAFSRAFKQWTGMSPLAYRRARSS